MNTWLLLAAVDPEDLKDLATNGSTGLAIQDILLLLAVLGIVALVLFLVVYLSRKKSRRYHTEGGAKVIYKAEKHEVDPRRRRRRRRRPDHPDNLPRNPTLAEAGGLPPVRPQEPSEPAR